VNRELFIFGEVVNALVMRVIIAVLLLYFFACRPKPPSDMVPRKIELINNIGTIELMLPAQMDTFCSWVNMSCTQCLDKQQFRYADTDYDVILETGNFNFDSPDSAYQFTVSQDTRVKCFEVQDTFINARFIENWEKGQRMNNQDVEIYFSGLENYDGRNFAVMANRTSSMDMNAINLSAYTVVNGQLICLAYSCLATNCDGFVEQMKLSLETIEINACTKPSTNSGPAEKTP
jgi:hypothetical protein